MQIRSILRQLEKEGLFMDHNPARGSAQDVSKTRGSSRGGSDSVWNLTGQVGSGQEACKCHGSG